MSFELAKQSFFDTERVLKAMDRAEQKALSKAGAFIWRRARSSLRKRKAPSQPGQPPSDHGGALKEHLYFAWDGSRRSVVAGPIRFGARRQSPRAPQALELGGVVSAITAGGEQVTRRYQARPFMGPALQAEIAAGTIAEQLRGSLST